MKLVTTFHPPSSVSGSLKCTLTSDSEFGHLVVAKINRVEVSSITREGLRPECEFEIWGRILAIRAIPVGMGPYRRHNILVMTDHPDPRISVLVYEESDGIGRLVETSSISLHDRIARHAEFCNDVVVDPTGSVAIASCYVGKLKVLRLKNGAVEEDFDVILPELNLLTVSFLHTPQDLYTLAIVHVDFQQRIQLISRDLHLDQQELSAELSQFLPSTPLSTAIFPFTGVPPGLISVPPFALSGMEGSDDEQECPGGVVVIGGRRIFFYELARPDKQSALKGKKRRLEKRKASTTESEVEKAKDKEKERESRKAKPRCFVIWPWSEVVAWHTIDVENRRYLLGDKFGRLSMLFLSDVPKLTLVPLGETSPPTTITYLSNQVLYIGSHLGPSQLIRLHQEIIDSPEDDTLHIPSGVSTVTSLSPRDEGDEDEEGRSDNRKASGIILRSKGVRLEVLATYRNIAPIMDAVLADPEFSGQTQVITCSGGSNSGSLNVVRSGAELNELAVLEDLSCITSLFPIRPRFESSHHSHLLVSTAYESYVLRLDGQDSFSKLEAADNSFVTTTPTLALSNMSRRKITTSGGKTTSSYVDSTLVVQVTSNGIRVLAYEEGTGIFHVVGGGWSPDSLDHSWQGREVIAASVNPSQIVLAFSRGRLALFNLTDDKNVNLLKYQDFFDEQSQPREISSVSCAPLDRTKYWSLYIAVSFWGSKSITILSLEKPERYMTPICSTSDVSSLPRSVLLHNFGTGNKSKEQDYQPYVLAGLTDGTVVSFAFRNNQLQDKKAFGLGTAPVTLSPCQVMGRSAVFASGSRASILHWDRKRLRQSSVMQKDVVTGVTLGTQAYPSVLVTATSSSLTVGQVGGIDKMQVRSIPLGLDNPTRIAHDSVANMFGVACLHPTPHRIGDAEIMQSSFNIYDSNLRRVGQYVCEANEEITAVSSSSTLLISADGRNHSCFVVGSVKHELGKPEPSLGRLMLFASGDAVSASSSTIRPYVSVETDGCVYAVGVLDNFIVAAVNTAVLLYRIGSDTDGVTLERTSTWNHNYFVTSLVVRHDTIVAGDAISSVTLLKVEESELRTHARDYGPLWPVAVELTPKGGIIGADCDCNLFTFSPGRTEGRVTLERDGSYHLGDVVNKFLLGSVGAQDANDGGSFQPEHLFFTSSGRVGQTIHVSDDIALKLTALQRNMAKLIKGAGDSTHTKARAPTNSRGRTDAESAFGFLDGDFLEQFLMESRQDDILQGELEVERVDMSRSEAEGLLETLQNLH